MGDLSGRVLLRVGPRVTRVGSRPDGRVGVVLVRRGGGRRRHGRARRRRRGVGGGRCRGRRRGRPGRRGDGGAGRTGGGGLRDRGLGRRTRGRGRLGRHGRERLPDQVVAVRLDATGRVDRAAGVTVLGDDLGELDADHLAAVLEVLHLVVAEAAGVHDVVVDVDNLQLVGVVADQGAHLVAGLAVRDVHVVHRDDTGLDVAVGPPLDVRPVETGTRLAGVDAVDVPLLVAHDRDHVTPGVQHPVLAGVGVGGRRTRVGGAVALDGGAVVGDDRDGARGTAFGVDDVGGRFRGGRGAGWRGRGAGGVGDVVVAGGVLGGLEDSFRRLLELQIGLSLSASGGALGRTVDGGLRLGHLLVSPAVVVADLTAGTRRVDRSRRVGAKAARQSEDGCQQGRDDDVALEAHGFLLYSMIGIRDERRNGVDAAGAAARAADR